MDQTVIDPPGAANSAVELLNELRQPVLVGLSKTLRRALAGTIDDLLERLLKESSWQARQSIDATASSRSSITPFPTPGTNGSAAARRPETAARRRTDGRPGRPRPVDSRRFPWSTTAR